MEGPDHAKIGELVHRTLERDPDLKSRQLYERASEDYPAVGEMTVRQFHARYAIPAKRRLRPSSNRRSGTARGQATASRRRVASQAPSFGDITSLVKAQIQEARNSVSAAIDAAVARTEKSGRLDDFERLQSALAKATREIDRILG